MDEKQSALVPLEQKQVLFYEDEITAVRTSDGTIYVPIRPICNLLGVSWTGQRRRINRDPVMAEVMTPVNVTFMGHEHGNPQIVTTMCLPLDYISGFLFGINASRVKLEFRERIMRYQRECFKVLSEAFQEGRLTADSTFSELLQVDSPAVQAYRMASAIMQMARQQILLEADLKTMKAQVGDNTQRLEAVEEILGDPGRHITPDQAAQISQAVKAVALALSKQSGRNEYGACYGEMYRKFGITSYKLLPASKFQEAMDWLVEWHSAITGDSPF